MKNANKPVSLHHADNYRIAQKIKKRKSFEARPFPNNGICKIVAKRCHKYRFALCYTRNAGRIRQIKRCSLPDETDGASLTVRFGDNNGFSCPYAISRFGADNVTGYPFNHTPYLFAFAYV